jgi:hypothetical protein
MAKIRKLSVLVNRDKSVTKGVTRKIMMRFIWRQIMFTLGIHFEKLLKNIRPPQERIDKAQDLPPKVRDYLKEHEDFVTLFPHSRLAGSYAQHLCVGDVKDVDFLIRVIGDPQENEPEAKQVIQDLKKALDGLPEALGYVGEA